MRRFERCRWRWLFPRRGRGWLVLLRLRVPGADQAGLVGKHHRLYPISQAELGQDSTHMGLDRALADEEGGADLGVGQPLCEESEYFLFALGERLELLVARCARDRRLIRLRRDKAPAMDRTDLHAVPLVHHGVARGRCSRRLQIRSFQEVYPATTSGPSMNGPSLTLPALMFMAMERGVNAQAAVMVAENASSSAWASHVAMSEDVSALSPGT